jgi:hypothetical protein
MVTFIGKQRPKRVVAVLAGAVGETNRYREKVNVCLV